MRSIAGEELSLPTLGMFLREDPLNQALLPRLLCAVSTRKYARTLDAMTIVAAMGIDGGGNKRMLGIIEGGSENSALVKSLLSDLVERGLSADEPRLYVLDGGKALHKAVKDTFGDRAYIQRCQVLKKRNVLSHLPQSEKENVSIALSLAYREFEYQKAKSALELLASNLSHRYLSVADSLREGMEETLTVHQLNCPACSARRLRAPTPWNRPILYAPLYCGVRATSAMAR